MLRKFTFGRLFSFLLVTILSACSTVASKAENTFTNILIEGSPWYVVWDDGYKSDYYRLVFSSSFWGNELSGTLLWKSGRALPLENLKVDREYVSFSFTTLTAVTLTYSYRHLPNGTLKGYWVNSLGGVGNAVATPNSGPLGPGS
jgi:hypothetical protein